ncbi:actin-binding Rho-activating protein [Drosophila virilis]|uniref:Costars domain-containing protein n=1 Tax=Drosophila virilis TaxID=7244 RepID=B4LE42_DROVI|nr:actin-binding Rho-activating protein [Drosophila virilis]EDW70085.1 uncharacterized protein Dvir_GJ13604 [Drosophila virilis]
MTAKESTGENSVSSRITLFNQQVEEHQQWQRINPFAHYSVRDMPKRSIHREFYGTPPAGSLSEKRALQAQVLSLQEILQLCELINENGEKTAADGTPEVSLTFGVLFEIYNHISDKLLGTLLCARKHKYIDFQGETLFQGRDDAQLVRLRHPFEELKSTILGKIENLRCITIVKPVEHPELRDAQLL